jgi:uncharacterized protein YggE
MNVRKFRLALIVSVLSITVLGSIAIYVLNNQKAPKKELYFQYPTGISSSLGTITSAETGEQYNTISVSGSGSMSAKAQEATVILGVQTQGKDASESISQNAELMTNIINGIKALGLTDENLTTVSYDVYPVYSTTNYTQIVGYQTVNMLSVKITDLELIGQVIDAAAENGANRIQGVSFGLSSAKQAELETQAYLAALGDAESKALLIAERLDVTITGVLSVSENVYQPYQPYYNYNVRYEGAASVSTPIIEGKLSVSVTVHIIYAFE